LSWPNLEQQDGSPSEQFCELLLTNPIAETERVNWIQNDCCCYVSIFGVSGRPQCV